MAIRIPSSKTYDRQNPKVRDNVIERVEVGAVEVVPNNEANTPIYTSDPLSGFDNVSQGYTFDFRKTYEGAPNNLDFVTAISYSGYTGTKVFHETEITIPITSKNKRITQVKLGENKEGEPNITYELYGTYKYGAVSCPYTGELVWISGNNYDFQVSYNIANATFGNAIKTTEGNYAIPKTFENEIKGASWQGSPFDITIKSEINVKETGNLKTAQIETKTIEGVEYISIKLKGFLCGVKSINMGGYSHTNAGVNTGFKVSGNMTGTWSEYTPTYVEITIYGNTIGIDLQDKTIYVPHTDKTSKKVVSFEGNELMQQTNQRNGVGALYHEYLTTQELYAKGKETATIRCSISDYYDYNSDEKVISIDNSTGKMSFKMYDQVIPMVYGADGIDRPMSVKQDGTPKVFNVLGSKIYYDGAVWQELSLQET